MTRQLTLLESPPEWRLDEATREVGRRGIAAARASLQAGTARRAAAAEAPRTPAPRRRSAA